MGQHYAFFAHFCAQNRAFPAIFDVPSNRLIPTTRKAWWPRNRSPFLLGVRSTLSTSSRHFLRQISSCCLRLVAYSSLCRYNLRQKTAKSLE